VSIEYTAPLTVARFMTSTAFIRFIVGPIGSGKTTGLLIEILRRGIEQRPGPDGIRRTRWAIVRQTLSQLKMTILLDLLSWFRLFATYRVSEQLVILEFNDVRIEIYMIPLEEEEDQKRLLSMQLTAAAVNEFTEISPDLVGAIAGRCGRFPSKAEGSPSWFGVIGDSNAPVENSEWWNMFENVKPADWAVFWQPDGLSAEAENVENLPPGYYQRLAENPNTNWVNRYVRAQYGEDPSGASVFRGSYKRSFHVRKNLVPSIGYPLIIGQDFGRSPCSLICQPNHKGQLMVLEEVVAEDIGLELHITRNLKPRLFHERYANLRYAVVGDPSGTAKSSLYEEDHFDVLKRLGLPAFPAPTNNIDPRISAVESLLLQHRDGEGAVLIDEDMCPITVRSIAGAYRYGKTQAGVTKPLPDKTHPYSDLMDDLQYVALVMNSGMVHAIAKKIRPQRAKHPQSRVSAAGWT